MSRSKDRGWRANYKGCSGCSACSWFPKRLQREGKRTEKTLDKEIEEETCTSLDESRDE